MLRKFLVAILASLALTIGLMPAAHAAVSAQVAGDRITVTISGKQPKKASLLLAGKSYRMKRSGKTWQTGPLAANVLQAAPGQKARVKATYKGKKKTLKATIAAGNNGGGGGGTGGGGGGGGGSQPLFAAPGVDRTGDDAWNAISGYFLNSTFTDCPSGFPSCPYETRYGHNSNFQMAYCRLTPTSGSDIINGLKPFNIVGAEQKADGSWAVSYQEDYGDGNNRVYTWWVAIDGSVTGAYWFNADTNFEPTERISGLVWVRGARDCSY